MKKILEELRKMLNEDSGEKNVLCDEIFIRELIADEYSAVKKYKEMAAKTIDPETEKLLLDIAKEEEVHIGELQFYLERMLQKHGQTSMDTLVKGANEVQNLLNEDFSDDLKNFIVSNPNIMELLHKYLNHFYPGAELTDHEIISSQVRIGHEMADVVDAICHSLQKLDNNKEPLVYSRELIITEMFKLIVNAEHSKNISYRERDILVALISKVFPSYLAKHDPNDKSWDKDWTNIVYVNLPTGQCSWHIKDDELPLFSHLECGENNWDGHTTEEKYVRIVKYTPGINRVEHPLGKYLD